MTAFVFIKISPRRNKNIEQHLIHGHTTIYLQGHAQLGTLRYMSPEILEGSVNLSSSWCLMQADIYALGLLLWEIWMCCSDLFEGKLH